MESARSAGYDLTLCVRAIDASTQPMVCAGRGDTLYAASVTKLASAVAALEAHGGDPDAETPLGVTVGDLVDDAISASDNHAADLLTLLAAESEPAGSGPGESEPAESAPANPFEAVNAITARVGLDEAFHAGNYYTESYWSTDWSHIDAAGAPRYLTELVRAADATNRTRGDDLLTDPSIARYVLARMLDQERTAKIPAELPDGTTANKTGETDTVSHDLAVLNTADGRLVMSMASTAAWLGGGPHEAVAGAADEVVGVFGGPQRF